jgi:hypothetical protein
MAKSVMTTDPGFWIDISFIHDRDLLVRSVPLHETENSVDSYCRPDWQDIFKADRHDLMRADGRVIRMDANMGA